MIIDISVNLIDKRSTHKRIDGNAGKVIDWKLRAIVVFLKAMMVGLFAIVSYNRLHKHKLHF